MVSELHLQKIKAGNGFFDPHGICFYTCGFDFYELFLRVLDVILFYFIIKKTII